MENFSKLDIFATKGIEYLFALGYILLLTIFWNIARRKKTVERIKEMAYLTSDALRIPQGIFFSRSHTWTHLEPSGEAKVGMDDFIRRIVGDYKFNLLNEPGDLIQKGDLLVQVGRDGRCLDLFSPISGIITGSNPILAENAEIPGDFQSEKTWVYKIKPVKWKEETASYLMAEDATNWFNGEIARFKDLVAGGISEFTKEPSAIMMQDGGDIRVNALSVLPEAVWAEFQKEFLSPDRQ